MLSSEICTYIDLDGLQIILGYYVSFRLNVPYDVYT